VLFLTRDCCSVKNESASAGLTSLLSSRSLCSLLFASSTLSLPNKMAISSTNGGTATRPARQSTTAAISKQDDSDASEVDEEDDELSEASFVSEEQDEDVDRPERIGKREEEVQEGPGANWEVAVSSLLIFELEQLHHNDKGRDARALSASEMLLGGLAAGRGAPGGRDGGEHSRSLRWRTKFG
jgi:hypothetical protein